MKTFLFYQKCRKLVSFGVYSIRLTFTDAILCAVCFALYGIVFWGLGAQARHELTIARLMSVAGNCGLIGAVIGMSVGVIRELSRVIAVRQRIFERAQRIEAAFSQRAKMPSTIAVQKSLMSVVN